MLCTHSITIELLVTQNISFHFCQRSRRLEAETGFSVLFTSAVVIILHISVSFEVGSVSILFFHFVWPMLSDRKWTLVAFSTMCRPGGMVGATGACPVIFRNFTIFLNFQKKKKDYENRQKLTESEVNTELCIKLYL